MGGICRAGVHERPLCRAMFGLVVVVFFLHEFMVFFSPATRFCSPKVSDQLFSFMATGMVPLIAATDRAAERVAVISGKTKCRKRIYRQASWPFMDIDIKSVASLRCGRNVPCGHVGHLFIHLFARTFSL